MGQNRDGRRGIALVELLNGPSTLDAKTLRHLPLRRWPGSRIAIVLVVGLVLTACAVGVAWCFSLLHLPSPSLANREQLLQWLVLRELSEYPPAIRRDLARALDREYGHGPDWSALDSLDEATRRRLWDNFGLLVEPWLTDYWRQYQALPAVDRSAFLEKLIGKIRAWQRADGQSSPAARLIAEKAEVWRAHAQSGDREQIGQFLAAIQAQWLIQEIRAWSASK